MNALEQLSRLSLASERLLAFTKINPSASVEDLVGSPEFREWKDVLEKAREVAAADKPLHPEQQFVFAMSPLDSGGHLLAIGLTPASWDYIKDGTCQTVDLFKVGYPMQVIVFGGTSKEQIMDMLKTGARGLRDVTNLDLRIDKKK